MAGPICRIVFGTLVVAGAGTGVIGKAPRNSPPTDPHRFGDDGSIGHQTGSSRANQDDDGFDVS